MKFYLDEDLSPRIADILSNRGADAVSAHEIGMIQASDLEQLERATAGGRCFVTRNRNDFIALTVQFFNEHRSHFGLLIVPYSLPGDRPEIIARSILKYTSDHPKGMSPYAIDFLKP